MSTQNYWAAILQLRKAGFNALQISRLCKLHGKYTETEIDQNDMHYRRLEFARWLVTHGKLTEQIA